MPRNLAGARSYSGIYTKLFQREKTKFCDKLAISLIKEDEAWLGNVALITNSMILIGSSDATSIILKKKQLSKAKYNY